MIEEIQEEEVEETIRQTSEPVAVDFWMDDCPPCNMMAPKLKSTAEAFSGRVRVYRINIDEASPLLEQYEIESMPAILFFTGGELAGRFEGSVSHGELKSMFEEMASTAG